MAKKKRGITAALNYTGLFKQQIENNNYTNDDVRGIIVISWIVVRPASSGSVNFDVLIRPRPNMAYFFRHVFPFLVMSEAVWVHLHFRIG